jgi:CrcB protein
MQSIWPQCGLVALGGAMGAVCRYLVGTLVQSHFPKSTFPWGTFLINVSGSLVLGFLSTLLAERVLASPNWRPLVTIGFIGAYTTFSTFEYETVQLGTSWQALGNVFGSIAVGYGGVIVGIRLANSLVGMLARSGAHGS